MMGRETTGKGHSWMGGHCKYDGWMDGERHVFLRMLLLLFVFVSVFDFDFLSLLLTARNYDGPCCTRDSRMETVRYIELPTYGLYVMKVRR